MLRRILITALVAGFVSGLVVSVVQAFTTTPIILHAETFENGGGGDKHADSTGRQPTVPAHAPAGQAAPAEDWSPRDGLERALYTTLANLLAGVGFALILAAALALYGRAVDGRDGVLWGIAGFTVFTLAPALGLPPEVPGAMAADLAARQTWWFLCVAVTAGGLWLLAFQPGAVWKLAGVALLAAPHIVGAPGPARVGGPVPPEIAGHFAAASIVTAFVFWCLLGWMSGTVWQRLARR